MLTQDLAKGSQAHETTDGRLRRLRNVTAHVEIRKQIERGENGEERPSGETRCRRLFGDLTSVCHVSEGVQ